MIVAPSQSDVKSTEPGANDDMLLLIVVPDAAWPNTTVAPLVGTFVVLQLFLEPILPSFAPPVHTNAEVLSYIVKSLPQLSPWYLSETVCASREASVAAMPGFATETVVVQSPRGVLTAYIPCESVVTVWSAGAFSSEMERAAVTVAPATGFPAESVTRPETMRPVPFVNMFATKALMAPAEAPPPEAGSR